MLPSKAVIDDLIFSYLKIKWLPEIFPKYSKENITLQNVDAAMDICIITNYLYQS
jgi:hypothetical protein